MQVFKRAIAAIFLIGIAAAFEEWIAKDEFSDKIPADVQHFKQLPAKTSGVCQANCEMLNCSSLAYSVRYNLCRLYSHPDLASPLPKLKKDDTDLGFSMHYKRLFCPPGWLRDKDSQLCYFADPTRLVKRVDAWAECEERFMSQLPKFENAAERSRLYQILQQFHSTATKWWNGYYLFDNRHWVRSVEELPGLIKRRGDCSGYDIDFFNVPVEECHRLCAGDYKDLCTGFFHRKTDDRCILKHKTCEAPGFYSQLDQYIWYYERIDGARPPMKTVGQNVVGYDLQSKSGISRYDCHQLCKNTPPCVAFVYDPPTPTCWLKWKTSMAKSGSSADREFYDMGPVNNGPCVMGIRYRDVCLVIQSTRLNYDQARLKCQQMGGKLVTPVETAKLKLLFGAHERRSLSCYVDGSDEVQENVWRSKDGLLTFSTQPDLFEFWKFASGQPSGGAGVYCPRTMTKVVSQTEGNTYTMDDVSCNQAWDSICELPISMSFPQNCRFTTPGKEYMGRRDTTASGAACKMWSSTTKAANKEAFPDLHTNHKFCRNPDSSLVADSPWCYRESDDAVETCDIPLCDESDWKASQNFNEPYSPYSSIVKTPSPDGYDWQVEQYGETASPICQLKMDDWCQYYFRGSCYKFFYTYRNHDDAKAVCEKNGWHLLYLDSHIEHDYIRSIIKSYREEPYYNKFGYHIGMKKIDGQWQYDNGVIYDGQARLHSGQGTSQDCGILWQEHDGFWADYHCWYELPFICELEIAK